MLKYRRLIPLLVFVLALVALLVSLSVSGRAPTIAEISPAVVRGGEVIRIIGSSFGSEQSGSRVVISGITPTRSQYLLWSEDEVQVRVPRRADSGLVYVETANGRSEGALLRVQSVRVPATLNESDPGQPRITLVEPEIAAPGDVIAIRGRGFGSARGESTVAFEHLFSETARAEDWLASPDPFEGGYLFWSDREIRVRVPTFADTGPLRVIGEESESNAADISIARSSLEIVPLGSYEIGISYRLMLEAVGPSQGEGRTGASDITAWFPVPSEIGEQPRVQSLSRNRDSLLRRKSVEAIPFPLDETKMRISGSWLVESLGYRFSFAEQGVSGDYSRAEDLVLRYTRDEPHLPMTNPWIQFLALRYRNLRDTPVRLARAFVDEIRSAEDLPSLENSLRLLADGTRTRDSVLSDIHAHDVEFFLDISYQYASQLVALLRLSGIPARVISGVRASQSSNQLRGVERSFWVEFFVPNVGWVPADPRPSSARDQDIAVGLLDGRRVIFTKGFIDIPSRSPVSKTRGHTNPVGLVSHELEYGGAVEVAMYWELPNLLSLTSFSD